MFVWSRQWSGLRPLMIVRNTDPAALETTVLQALWMSVSPSVSLSKNVWLAVKGCGDGDDNDDEEDRGLIQ